MPQAEAPLNSLGLPLRPGASPCAFYVQHGSCRFGSRCRYNHPEPTQLRQIETLERQMLRPGWSPQKTDQRRPAENLFKTRVCRNWERDGTCADGANCRFAHGERELRALAREPPPRGSFSGIAARPDSKLFKTQLCRHWERFGSCIAGLECGFAHGEAELRQGGLTERDRFKTDFLRKTRMCAFYQRDGSCSLGEKCFFAHGEAELRSRPGTSSGGGGGAALTSEHGP